MTEEDDLFKKEMASMDVTPLKGTPPRRKRTHGADLDRADLDRADLDRADLDRDNHGFESRLHDDEAGTVDPRDEELFLAEMEKLANLFPKKRSPRHAEPARRPKEGRPAQEPNPTDHDLEPYESELFLRNWNKFTDPPAKDEPPDPPRGIRKIKISSKVMIDPHDCLDLHGKTVDEALEQLGAFIAASRGVHKVKIITGKGRGSKDGISKLKPAVEQWIWHKGAPYIHSFGDAPHSLGGTGALILFLRRY